LCTLGGFTISPRVALLWQHNANPSYKLASIPRYDDIVRTLGGVCVHCWLVPGGVAITTKSLAYNSSHGKAILNSVDMAFMTITHDMNTTVANK